ncbi:MAG: DUF4421 domain-containing protein [Chitinophagales bacterium]|nr:DUF4421 domain-containing protein [Chitinophagales bacterium]
MKYLFVTTAAFVLLFFLQSNKSFCQVKFTLIKTDIDSSYIERRPSSWSARIFGVSKSQTFSLSDLNSNLKVSFVPNAKASLGLGVSYGNFALDLGVNISHTKKDTLNQTKSFDFLSTLVTNQHVLGFNFQLHGGFFSSTQIPLVDTPANSFRSDIRTFNLGINYLYNFGYRKFSFNAAFLGAQIQKQSAGAPVVGVFFTYYDLRSNDNLIPTDLHSSFSSYGQISEANLLSSGLLAGYAYTLVLPKSFYISVSLVPGIAFNIGDAKSENYYHIGHPVTVSPKLESLNAVGYGGKKFYAVLSYSIDQNFVNLGNKNQLNYNASKAKFVFGIRIK